MPTKEGGTKLRGLANHHKDEVKTIAREVAQSVANDIRREINGLRIDMNKVDTQLSDRLVNDIRMLHLKINNLHPRQ